jgi:hypothetical protein
MSKCAAVFLWMAFGLPAAAGAANVSAPPAKTPTPTAAPALAVAVKATKTDAPAAKGPASATTPEAFANPYETPLLLNAKPLAIGRP